VTACHWFLVGGPEDRASGFLCYHRGVFGRANSSLGIAYGSGEDVPPQRIERYHRAQLMSIKFVPGHARTTGPVSVWTVIPFPALLWSLQSKLKI